MALQHTPRPLIRRRIALRPQSLIVATCTDATCADALAIDGVATDAVMPLR